MTSSEYVVGRTMRIEGSPFHDVDVSWGPSHAVRADHGFTAECGVVVHDLLGPWPPRGPGSAPACPDCAGYLPGAVHGGDRDRAAGPARADGYAGS